jgi:hypothetical protein
MLQNKRLSTGGLVLAGLAAFAYYKYSQMSDQEKTNLVGDLKEKGKKLYDQYMPEQVKNMFAKNEGMMGNSNSGVSNQYAS